VQNHRPQTLLTRETSVDRRPTAEDPTGVSIQTMGSMATCSRAKRDAVSLATRASRTRPRRVVTITASSRVS